MNPTTPTRSRGAEALLERLDQLERSDVQAVGKRFMVPGHLLSPDDELATNVAGYIDEKGRVESAHRVLDEMGAA